MKVDHLGVREAILIAGSTASNKIFDGDPRMRFIESSLDPVPYRFPVASS
jgi:hypothetical protein